MRKKRSHKQPSKPILKAGVRSNFSQTGFMQNKILVLNTLNTSKQDHMQKEEYEVK